MIKSLLKNLKKLDKMLYETSTSHKKRGLKKEHYVLKENIRRMETSK